MADKMAGILDDRYHLMDATEKANYSALVAKGFQPAEAVTLATNPSGRLNMTPEQMLGIAATKDMPPKADATAAPMNAATLQSLIQQTMGKK